MQWTSKADIALTREASRTTQPNWKVVGEKLGFSAAACRSRWFRIRKDTPEGVGSRERDLEKQVERLEKALESQRQSRIVIPTGSKRKEGKGAYCRVIVPDSHGANIDHGAANAFLSDLETIGPAEIVFLGDHLDCGGWLAQHHTMGFVPETAQTFEDDVNAANEFISKVQEKSKAGRYVYVEGNHECLHPDHEVLTDKGWKSIADIDVLDKVATLNENKKVEWQNPEKVHQYDFDGSLVVAGRKRTPYACAMTPNHRVCRLKQADKSLQYILAENIVNGKHGDSDIPVSGVSDTPDYDISDDELRLLGWILTDGTVSQKVTIYQSKPENIEVIEKLLTRIGVSFTKRTRLRECETICGRQVINAMECAEFNILAESHALINKVVDIEFGWHKKQKKVLPKYAYQLSKWQFDVLLNAIIDGDGSRVGEAATVYGTEEFLSDLQGVASVNGYRASLSYRRRSDNTGYWALNLCNKKCIQVQRKYFKEERYRGKVHCLTMPNGNFFTRYKGRVSVTGNSRIEKGVIKLTGGKSADAAYMMRLWGPKTVLAIEKRGIEWIGRSETYGELRRPGAIKLGKCIFTHGQATGSTAAWKMLHQWKYNVAFGHCFSSDTEVLTDHGWRRFDQIVIGTNVMTAKLENGHAEWQAVTDVFRHDHYRELLHIKSTAMDAMVTDDHAMVVTHSSKPWPARREAAKHMLGRFATQLLMGAVNGQADHDISDDMIRLVGWYVTEGSVDNHLSRGGYIRLHQSDSPKGGMQELDDLLARMGVRHSKKLRYKAGTVGHGQHRRYDAYRYNISRTDPATESLLAICPDKQLGDWIFKLSARQAWILFETLILTDGCKNKQARNSYQFCTNIDAEADRLQAFCSINGWRCSRITRTRRGADYNVLTINTNPIHHVPKEAVSRVPYNGSVWCCSVPNQTLVVRRGGKSFIAGNTHRISCATQESNDEPTLGAWSFGCLCRRVPLWYDTRASDWSHGYGLQVVQKDGHFLTLQIPIIDGVSLLQPLASKLRAA